MDCPRDETALRQVMRGGATIDVCDACGGKWLDEGELEQLVLSARGEQADAARLKTALATAERSFYQDGGHEGALACPRCDAGMRSVRFESGGAQVTADRCARCMGFWLDKGEAGSLFVFLQESLPVRRKVWIVAASVLALTAVLWMLSC
jgi:Zn-finger nucleic acid-binding protein